MADDNRSHDRQDLDAMTRAFLAKGGAIVHCPPGASENVVYRKGSFRRRAPADGKAAAPTNGTEPTAETLQASATDGDTNTADTAAVPANTDTATDEAAESTGSESTTG
ncbi:hypothetical protein [Azospirillum sp. TSO35-2]|uniref:hypothetical protein n=1 Tax=Azospirillum sp. TSO35-2 TaxID=716796 RepID=UPI000D64716B|nr:hypothetical protein [Azospirillum sp. TSO35-2]